MAGTGKDDNGASRRICLEPQIFLFFSVSFIYLLLITTYTSLYNLRLYYANILLT